MSEYDCASCGATPDAAAIYRTSPKGQPFEGKCARCLGADRLQTTFGDRLFDALEPILETKGALP